MFSTESAIVYIGINTGQIGDVIRMDFLAELRSFEKQLLLAENTLLKRDVEVAHQVIQSLSDSALSDLIPIDTAIERMQTANDRNYCSFSEYFYLKWDELDEGYRLPKLHYSTQMSRFEPHSWYTEMIANDAYYDFIRKLIYGLSWNFGRQEGEHYEGLPELLALSTLRKHTRQLWERLVIDIIRSRHRTSLEAVAKLLGLKLSWVFKICENYKPTSSRMGVFDKIVKDEMVYLCVDPDYGIIPLIDLPEPPEAKVVYLVICPNCKHRNEQGRTTCENCNAPL